MVPWLWRYILSMNKPTDTTKAPPEAFLGEALAVGSSQAIENQEARGQAELVESDVLPTTMHPDNPSSMTGEEILKAAGVEFLGVLPEDPLFQRVKLPAGWRKLGDDHPMWSSLVDDKGMERAAIFYKAAFYDRKSWMSVYTTPRERRCSSPSS